MRVSRLLSEPHGISGQSAQDEYPFPTGQSRYAHSRQAAVTLRERHPSQARPSSGRPKKAAAAARLSLRVDW